VKIKTAVFKEFLTQIQGPGKGAIDEGTITIADGKMVAFIQNITQDHQVKVEYTLEEPCDPFEMNLSNIGQLLLALKRFDEETLDITLDGVKVKIAGGRKSFQIPTISKQYIRQGKEFKQMPPITFDLLGCDMEDFLGDFKAFGDRPLVVIKHVKGTPTLEIVMESDRLSNKLDNTYDIDPDAESFEVKFRNFDALEKAKGKITFFVGNGAPLMARYSINGLTVEHGVAPQGV